ncbi:zinc metallopeptidase [candidate division WOR-3 bacterium]|nr:zinc metallopeptidase [candidate division WOR-3 bacterium]
MWWFDPLYIFMMIPVFIISIIAQMWVKSAYAKYSRIPNRNRVTGAEAAQIIARRMGLQINVELTSGLLSDHYDPRTRTLRLSPHVYNGYSIAAVGIAAHEAGHAIQHAHGYAPLQLRNALVPVTMLGSNLAWPLIFVGFVFHWLALIKVGILFFTAVVVFQLITLPVEFNASRRALKVLHDTNILTKHELPGAREVLTAAALTYVAAATAAILQLLYFLIRAGLIGGHEE